MNWRNWFRPEPEAAPEPAAEPEPPAWMRLGESRAVDVGWLLDTDKARFIWAEPQRVRRSDPAPTHAESASYWNFRSCATSRCGPGRWMPRRILHRAIA